MNSYNKNLTDCIKKLLQNPQEELALLKSQCNIAESELRFVERALADTRNELKLLDETQIHRRLLVEKAEAAVILCANLVEALATANVHVKQSVTNTAICAADVQIAANSIMRLASDVESVFSIVNAADFGSDIFIQTEEIRLLMNRTAYEAELASQNAMYSSMYTSEISSSILVDKSMKLKTGITNFFHLLSDEHELAIEAFKARYKSLYDIRTKLGSAQSLLRMKKLEYGAESVYLEKVSKNLNQYLQVEVRKESISISFNLLMQPFAQIFRTQTDFIKDYFFLFAKECSAPVITPKFVDQLLSAEPNRLIQLKTAKPREGISVLLGKKTATIKIGYTGASIPFVEDIDGDSIHEGEAYVAYVFAVYQEDYKKSINDFDDYLSAPSPAFRIGSSENNITAEVKTMHSVSKNIERQLNKLAVSVREKQYAFDEQQAIVDKLLQFETYVQDKLSISVEATQKAYNRLKLIEDIVQQILDISTSLKIVSVEVEKAAKEALLLTDASKPLADKLMFCAQKINRLCNMIVRKKALNPLISDELVSMISTACADTNNSIAFTLTALDAVFMAQQFYPRVHAYQPFMGDICDQLQKIAKTDTTSLCNELKNVYQQNKAANQKAEKALNHSTAQLNIETAKLNGYGIELRSKEAGLAAAKAAIEMN